MVGLLRGDEAVRQKVQNEAETAWMIFDEPNIEASFQVNV